MMSINGPVMDSYNVDRKPVRMALASIVIACAMIGSPAFAQCLEEQRDTAAQLAVEAANTTDEIDRMLLLKRSAKVCSTYAVWLSLGQVELELENYLDAAYAFENAVEFYRLDGEGTYTPVEVQRKAVANAWLAETYVLNDEMALASVATQESAAQFSLIGQALPERLVRLQAKLDDVMTKADSTVLARSFEIQHERKSRGIGVRLRQGDEDAAALQATQAIVAEYTGEPVSDTMVASLASVREDTELAQADSGSEARLNIPVLFRFDSATLTEESWNSITQLATALKSLDLTGEDSVLVVGHTDSRGAAAYNLDLSERRAASVNETLQDMLGNSPVKLSAQGRGEEELRFLGNTRDDHRRNRRVELIVVRRE